MNRSHNCVIILGPTASGKTKLAVQTALQVNGEIISADSRQVYKKLDIGTGKDLVEYANVPYHLIDVAEPTQKFNVFDFANHFYKAFNDVVSRAKTPVICGGTGLYFDVLLKKNELVAVPVNDVLRRSLEHKPKEELLAVFTAYNYSGKYRFDTSTLKRLTRAVEVLEFLKSNPVPPIQFHDLNPLIIGVKTSLEQRRKNISLRLKHRLEHGLIEEAQQLLKEGVSHEQLQYFGLEYKFLSLYLLGKIDREQLFKQLETAIHQYAKRQMTWWRKMEKEGFEIKWIQDIEELEELLISNC